jgi:hypothetical protein
MTAMTLQASDRLQRRALGDRFRAHPSLDARAAGAHLRRMANPLDREIDATLRKGREPESWKRPGAKRENLIDQRGTPASRPVGESGKPPGGTGMNRPGHRPR